MERLCGINARVMRVLKISPIPRKIISNVIKNMSLIIFLMSLIIFTTKGFVLILTGPRLKLGQFEGLIPDAVRQDS